jgi:hypothetical protein
MEFPMNKFIKIAAALVLATGVAATASAPSQAAPFPAGFAAGVAGFVVGAAVASAAEHDGYGYGYGHHHHFHGGAWAAHVDACYDEFKSYDEYSDTYLGFDGYRHVCYE